MSTHIYYLVKNDILGQPSRYTVDRIINEAVSKAVDLSHEALCDERDGVKTMNQIIDRKIASDVTPMYKNCLDTIDFIRTNCDNRLDVLELASLEMNNRLEKINQDIEQIGNDKTQFEADISKLKLANEQYIDKFTNIDKRFNNVNTNYLKKAETDNAINAFLTTNIFDVVEGKSLLKEQYLTRYDTSIKDTYLTKTDATSTYQTITDTTNKYNELKSLINTRPTYDEIQYYFLTKEEAKELVTQINLLKQQVSELNTRVESLETANQKHIEDINKLEGNVNKVNLENDQFQESIEALRNDLTENQKVDDSQTDQIDGIKQNIDEIKQDIGEIDDKVIDNKTDIENIRENINEHTQSIETISKTVKSHGDSIRQLDAEVFKGLN